MPLSSAAIGQQRGVGARGEAAHREVRDEVEAEHREQEHPEVGREVGLLGEQQQHVAAGGDDDGQEPEPELAGCAAGAPRVSASASRAAPRWRSGVRRRGRRSVVRRSWWWWSSSSSARARMRADERVGVVERRERLLARATATCVGGAQVGERRALVRRSTVGSHPSEPAGHALEHGHPAAGRRRRSSCCARTSRPRRPRRASISTHRRAPTAATAPAGCAPGSAARAGARVAARRRVGAVGLVDPSSAVRRRPRRRSATTCVGTGVVVGDRDDDDGDVVDAAGGVGGVDELVRGDASGSGSRRSVAAIASVVQHVGEAVGAEQDAVAGLRAPPGTRRPRRRASSRARG